MENGRSPNCDGLPDEIFRGRRHNVTVENVQWEVA